MTTSPAITSRTERIEAGQRAMQEAAGVGPDYRCKIGWYALGRWPAKGACGVKLSDGNRLYHRDQTVAR